ncbi:MAG: M50 family metallopeptidase [Erythrobacter sp.]
MAPNTGLRVRPGSQTEQVGRLALAAMLVWLLPALPFGNYVVYPFLILTTWFHEMGHGMAALATGQDFQRLVIFPNGSGFAESAIAADAGIWVRVAIAAGGPLGPMVVGALLIMASAHERLWRPSLWLMAGAIVVSVALYVRSPVGIIVLPLVAGLLGLTAWRARPALMRFVLQFIGVLGAMSMLRDFNYLFTAEAVINGQQILSDTGQIALLTGLPHWLWAAAILLLSGLMLAGALKYALAERRPRRPANVLQFKQGKR